MRWKEFQTRVPDAEQINAWWQRWPDALIGLATGARSGLLVIDLDVKDGRDGPGELERLAAGRGIPDCPAAQTRSGGAHLFFRHLPGARNSASKLAPGIDVRAEGGYVVVYDPLLTYAAAPECPEWLATPVLASSLSQPLLPAEDDPYAGERRPLTHAELAAAGGDSGAKLLVAQVARGEAWGSRGARDNDLVRLRMYLLCTYPWLDPEGTAELFGPSCAAVAAEDGAETTVAWVAEKLRAGIGVAMAARAREERDAVKARAAFGLPEPDVEPARDLVVQLGTGYFLRTADGDYDGPWSEKQVPTVARDLYASTPGVSLLTPRNTTKGAAQLAIDYGAARKTVVYDYSAQRAVLAPDAFVAKCAPRAVLSPQRNEQIGHWLSLLGGPQHGLLLDWLATLLDVAQPTAGLYVRADSGVGKSLLGSGLARLWEIGSACDFTMAVGRFNFCLTSSPLVWGDENLKLPHHDNQCTADVLKRLIDDRTRRVQEKYAAAAELRGSCRVLVTANRLPAELFADRLEVEDMHALDQRVLVIEPSRDAAAYLASLGGTDTTDAWVAGCGLARHVLWLAETRRVARGRRYLVHGRGFLDLLAAGDDDSRAVCLAVLRAAERPEIVRVAPEGRTGTWVCTSALRERWRQLLPDTPVPEDWRRACNAACEPGEAVRLRNGSEKISYRLLRPAVLSHVRASQTSE